MIVSWCQSKPLYVSIFMLYHEYNESRSMRNKIRIGLFYWQEGGIALAKKGRKSAYDTKIKPNFPLIQEMCNTMTDKQIAEAIGISLSTFMHYKSTKTEFSEVLKKGRQNLVAKLRGVLIERACGFQYTETKMIVDENGNKRKEVVKKQALPDVAALNLLLKNYDKNNWSNDPQELELKKRELELKEARMAKAMEDEW